MLIGATWAHAGNGWLFTAPNGGWEYPAFLAVAALVQALLGDGKFALSALFSRAGLQAATRITSYNVCYTKLLRSWWTTPKASEPVVYKILGVTPTPTEAAGKTPIYIPSEQPDGSTPT